MKVSNIDNFDILLLYLFIFWINHIIVPPEKPRVYTVDDNKEVRLKLGPYRVGETVRIRWEYFLFHMSLRNILPLSSYFKLTYNKFSFRCEALGGRPQPQVTWWRDHALLDDTFVKLGRGGNDWIYFANSNYKQRLLNIHES